VVLKGSQLSTSADVSYQRTTSCLHVGGDSVPRCRVGHVGGSGKCRMLSESDRNGQEVGRMGQESYRMVGLMGVDVRERRVNWHCPEMQNRI
jgi:hypothetical protein